MKIWPLVTLIAVSSFQLGARAATPPSQGKAKHLKVSGHLTGRLSLWPKETVVVALLPEAEADRLGAKVRFDDLKRIKPVKAASLTDKALQGTYEFQEVSSGNYRLIAFKTCPADAEEDAAVVGRADIAVADRNMSGAALAVSSTESGRKVMPLGMSSGATPCGEITRPEEKPAKGSGPGKTVTGKVLASSPMPDAGNVSAFLVEVAGRRFDSGLEIESRILIERQQQTVLAVDGAGRFKFTGVTPGAYRLEVRQNRLDRCIATPVVIGQEAVLVDAGDLAVDIRVNWVSSTTALC